jgi:hypothetical protein
LAGRASFYRTVFARIGSVSVSGRRQSTRIGKLEGFFDGGRDVWRWKRLIDFASGYQFLECFDSFSIIGVFDQNGFKNIKRPGWEPFRDAEALHLSGDY